jgi:hypothetical protein
MADNNGSGPLDIPSVRRRLARRARDERERGMVARIQEECPHLAADKFRTVVLGFARIVLTTHDLQAKLYQETPFDEDGNPRKVVDVLLKSLGLLLKYANSLGLTRRCRAVWDSTLSR